MASVSKLKLLIPVFQAVFPANTLPSLYNELVQKNAIKLKTGSKQKPVTSFSLLIPFIKEASIREFISVLEARGKTALVELTKTITSKRVDDHIKLLLKYWNDIVTCKRPGILDGLDHFFRGISHEDALTPNHWVEIINQLVKADSKAVKYFSLQVIKNASYYKHQEQGEKSLGGYDCFAEVFKPIFKSKLEDEHFVAIAQCLSQNEVISVDESEKIFDASKMHKVFLDISSRHFSKQYLASLSHAIESEGFCSFGGILKMYFQENNPKLFWLLVHWPKLIDRQTVVSKFAVKHRLAQQSSDEGEMWLFDVILKATTANNDETFFFFKAIETVLDYNLSIDLTQVTLQTKEETRKPATEVALKYENEIGSTARTGSQSSMNVKGGHTTSSCSMTYSQAVTGSGGGSLGTSFHRIQPLNASISENAATSPQRRHSEPSSAESSTATRPLPQINESSLQTVTSSSTNRHGYDLRSLSRSALVDNGAGKQTKPENVSDVTQDVVSVLHESQQQLVEGIETASLSSVDDPQEVSMDVEIAWQRQIQFCLLVDTKCELPVSKVGQVFVYINHSLERLPLCYDMERNHFFLQTEISSIMSDLVYKYLWVNSKGDENWEILPHERSGFVNRKFSLSQDQDKYEYFAELTVLFDVATFQKGVISKATDVSSMYSRTVAKHLPKINLLSLGVDDEYEFKLDVCLNELVNWYKCARAGVNYASQQSFQFQSKIDSSCLALLCDYVISNASFGTEKNREPDDVAVCKRILINLAILMVLNWNNVSNLHQRVFEPFCVGLSSGVAETSLKRLYDELKFYETHDRDLIKEACDGILFLNKQIEHPFLFLQLLPLYYALSNFGSCSYEEKAWADAVLAFAERKKVDSYKTEIITNIAPFIKELGKTFPKLPVLFESLIAPNMVLRMANTGIELSILKQSAVLISLLKEIEMKDFEIYFRSVSLVEWFWVYLDEIEQRCQKQAFSDEDVYEIVNINCYILNFFENKADTSFRTNPRISFNFLRIAVVMQGCLSHLVQLDSHYLELIRKLFEKLLMEIELLTKSDNLQGITEYQVKKWNFLLSPRLQCEDLKATWHAIISKVIQDNIREKLENKYSSAWTLFETDFEKWNASAELQSCMNEAVLAYALNLEHKEETWRIVSMFSRSGKNDRFKLVVSVFQQKFLDAYANAGYRSAGDRTLAVLNLASQWPFFVQFFKFFEDVPKKKALNAKVSKMLDDILHQLEIVEGNLKTGDLLYEHVEAIYQSNAKFEDVLGLLKKDCESALTTLTRNHKEMQAFLLLKASLRYCYDLCNRSDLRKNREDLMELKDFFEFAPYGIPWREVVDIQWENAEHIKVLFFGLNQETAQAFIQIYELKVAENDLARNVWLKKCHDLIEEKCDCDDNKPMLEVDDIVSLWRAVKRCIAGLRKQIVSGSLVLRDVESLFSNRQEKNCNKNELYKMVKEICEFPAEDEDIGSAAVSDEEYEDANFVLDDSEDDAETFKEAESNLARELAVVLDDDRDIHEVGFEDGEEPDKDQDIAEIVVNDELIYTRVDQISHFFTMQHDQNVADIFSKLIKVLDLKGDFSYLDLVLKQDLSGALPIKSITPDAITASEFMSSISLESVEFVKNFLKHEDLIQWLCNNMNRKEVKVMSDLAMISAGEDALEVDRVSCFLSAVMGFAPFLFDLRVDDCDVDLDALIVAFDKIPKTKEERKKLKAKWNQTNRYLDWLKQIKDFHGSVEKSSLSRAQDINSKGIYKIGGEEDKIPTTENSLKLDIPSDKNDSSSFTLSDLKSLESRLVLIAGEAEKGLDNVKVFTKVLTLVESLTNVYVKLKSAGCLLFSSWMARICCRNGSTSSCEDSGFLGSLEICFDDHSPSIICNEHVEEELNNLIAIMEDVYVKWKQNLEGKRSQFYHLNHFNIQQIMYLCRELAKVTNTNAVPDQVCTLLEFVKPSVCSGEIIALKEATKLKQDKEKEVKKQKEDEPLVTPLEQKRKMVHYLVKEGIPEKLAKAAVQTCELPLDENECFVKALELESTEYEADGDVNTLVRDFEKEAGFDASISKVEVIQSVVNNRSGLTLQEVIAEIVEKQSDATQIASVTVKTVCERYVSDIAPTSMNDCISIEHLGILLEKLCERNDVPYPDRQFPASFEAGKPNLVICQENEIFSTLLSIYTHSPGEPLPGLFEVLLCSEKTTEEEVGLFVRRAISFQSKLGSCIFCLAFADKLSYKVADATNSMIKQLEKQTKSEDYKLIVLCSSLQHSDYISSFLSENRVEYHPNRSLAEDAYLAKHLNLHRRHLLTLPMENHYYIRTSVLVVTSKRAGMGKSLHIQRWRERISKQNCRSIIIRLLEKHIDVDEVMQRMTAHTNKKKEITNSSPHFVHFDITPSVQHGFSPFFFNLMVLGGFKDSYGTLWRRQAEHVYFIEYTTRSNTTAVDGPKRLMDQNFFNLLPSVDCLSPCEVAKNVEKENVLKMDQQQFRSETFQRPYQYLDRYSMEENLDKFTYKDVQASPAKCINVLLQFCSLRDPTWSELRHFASFLNNQLRDCEKSFYCNENLVGDDSGLSGFKNFVVRFMIRMSQDFATPSLYSEDGSATFHNDIFEVHQLRRRWEESVHPYLFFNEDHTSVTFLNFFADANGNLLNPKNQLEILDQGLLKKELLQGLQHQKVPLNQNFDKLSRTEKLTIIYRVMGLEEDLSSDPDESYELTTDNALKILAIHMRLRCGIPVVIMGETGCGKTRMVEFLSKLKAINKLRADRKTEINRNVETLSDHRIRNMVIVKVHGGITVQIIQQKMKEAAKLAKRNKKNFDIDTLLFLDEANTTEAIYAIKEYVCDGTINGEAMQGSGLQIICACNPYRRHSKEAIKNMTEAGLGFRVNTEDTTDKLGEVPMRCLVYRVIALPPSMLPLVWDFGQLSEEAERIYIQQMVAKMPGMTKGKKLAIHPNDLNLIVVVLSVSQSYMRAERSQCLFVSLRDVERCLQCFLWFYQNNDWLYRLIDKQRGEPFPRYPMFSGVILQTLIHAIGMCYHVTLEKRCSYRLCISDFLKKQFKCALSPQMILSELTLCQEVFSHSLNLEENIARNEALMENTFMITMCIEMRIPLFLIGKPGSSKSLAKTVVTDAMQGGSSESKVYQKLKQIHVLSFQCSAVSDASGIASVFNQCEKVQANQNPDKFVSVVVLDEVGLAEDSPKMPLKVLHPLLEGSSADLEKPKKDKRHVAKKETNSFLRRVGFVGISNWALDPAKMNRGIFVVRGDPNKGDLELTAKGMFSELPKFDEQTKQVVKLLTDAYLEIRRRQDQEFFGLRDYYGLLKMIFAVVKKDDIELDFFHVSDAIKRNFSGGNFDCFQIFLEHLKQVWPEAENSTVSVRRMIKNNLESVKLENGCESRFLLLLTNRFAAINLINNVIDGNNFQVIFGSSFPRDSDYIELCRNINKIKICMESGCTVVLLNLRDLYESLYDALNQHYVTFSGQRYVDLGLGGHRVKCRVAKGFRLIVIEDKNVVYDEFPIPLINRLEKYIFTSESILDGDNVQVAKRLRSWIERFTEIDIPLHKSQVLKQFTVDECFPGFNEDSSASAVANVKDSVDKLQEAQFTLLNTATVDSIYRLHHSRLKKEAERLQKVYLKKQSHDNLVSLFLHLLEDCQNNSELRTSSSLLLEITSFSHILSETDRKTMEKALKLPRRSVMLLTLQQFQTLDEYTAKVKTFFEFSLEECNDEIMTHILFIQCPQAHKHSNLIACARFSIKNIVQEIFQSRLQTFKAKVFVAFLYTMDRLSISSGKSSFSFHSSDFTSLFVDELRPSVDYMGPPSKVFNKTVGQVFEESVTNYRFSLTEMPSKFAQHDYILDPNKLVRDSVSGALIRVKPPFENKDRNRMQLVQSLFRDNHPVALPFQDILLKQIEKLLEERDRNIRAPSDWSINEACLRESLCENGTFTKTLWLRLKKTVTIVLAKILSVLDEDNNLDLLCNEKFCRVFGDFWLEIFQSDGEVCKFALQDILDNKKEIVMRGTEGFSCRFPFSRSITECFVRLWNFSQMSSIEQQEEIFFTKVGELKMSQIVSQAFSRKHAEVLEHYIHDLIRLQCKFEFINEAEFQLCERTLMVLFRCKHESNPNNCNFLATAYSLLASSDLQLQQMHAVLKMQPELLKKPAFVQKLFDNQNMCKDFVLHVAVLEEVVIEKEKQFSAEYLKELEQPSEYQRWKELLRTILNLKVDVSSLDPNNETLCNVKKKRNGLAFVDLFLSVLMPDCRDKEEFQHYWTILASLSIRLSKGAHILELNSAKFLKIVISILQKCCKKLFAKLLLSWKDIICNSCKNMIIEPVILPCQHYFCFKCIQQVAKFSRQCSMCREAFPVNYRLEVAKLSQEKKQEYEDFKQNCTSFFLQYLSTLCFPTLGEVESDATVSKDVWNCLQELVVGEKETREMTPIDMESFDEAPTVRSFILQLLLRYNRENTQELLENHFQKMEKVMSDRKQLMIIYVRCVEDLHQVQANQSKISGLHSYQEFLNTLIQELLESYSESIDNVSQVKTLNVAAAARFLMKTAAETVHEIAVDETEEVKELSVMFLRSVCDVLEHCEIPKAKEYFVKHLCRRFGFSDYQQFLNGNSDFYSLIPSEINPESKQTSSFKSSLFVLGTDFIEAQTRLLQVECDDDFEECIDELSVRAAQSNDAAVQILHAVQSWISKTVSEEGIILRNSFWKAFLQEMTNLLNVRDNLIDFFTELNSDQLFPSSSAVTALILQEFVMVVGSTISVAFDNNLAELDAVMTDPYRITTSFIPTMPLSSFFDDDVQAVLKNIKERHSGGPPKSHLCPSGHVYFIGDCTNAEELGQCPECKQAIGGTHGKLQPGNVAGVLEQSSQMGYLLPNPEDRPTALTPERNCSKLDVCTIRMFLHAVMLHANNKHLHMMSHLKQSDRNATSKFLFHQLQIDFKQLMDCLGKSADDTALLLHQVMKKMRTQNFVRMYGSTLSTIQGRKVWEDEFRRNYLSSAFENADDLIEEARMMCWSNQQQSDLERLVYEIPDSSDETIDSDDATLSISSPYLWNYDINVTISHLRQKLEGLISHDKREGQLLKLLLNETDLNFVQFLPSILTLQNVLIQRYERKVDANDVENISLNMYCDEEDRIISDAQFQLYIRVWNAVKGNLLDANHTLKVSKEELAHEMNMESPVSMCLPSTAGKGRCALLMVEYLVEKQNNLLSKCKDLLPNSSFTEVSVDQLSMDDLICIDDEQALMPLVLSNSQYQVTVGDTGSKHTIVYRFAALEKQVAEKFIINKKFLKKQSLQQIKYLQDTGLGAECENMQNNVKQEPLPKKISQRFDELIARSHLPEICEGVRTLALVVSYLAKLESDPTKLLKQYVTDELFIPSEEANMIPKDAKLCHTMALYERLSWQRSLRFVLNNQDPFINFNLQEQKENKKISDKEIKESLIKLDLSLLQLELNSLMLLKSELDLNTSLRDYLIAYIESKTPEGMDADVGWCRGVHEKLRVSDAPRLFKMSVVVEN